MMKDTIKIGGREYRVEVNWNALAAYLASVGRDSFEELTQLSNMKITDVAPLMAAAINEGERLEGRECKLTPLELGAMMRPNNVGEFMDIYIRQSRAQVEEEVDAKKKDSPEEA